MRRYLLHMIAANQYPSAEAATIALFLVLWRIPDMRQLLWPPD
jgi:hypothetical protein